MQIQNLLWSYEYSIEEIKIFYVFHFLLLAKDMYFYFILLKKKLSCCFLKYKGTDFRLCLKMIYIITHSFSIFSEPRHDNFSCGV